MAAGRAAAAKWAVMAGPAHEPPDNDLLETLAAALPKQGLWDWPLLVGVSGGADSVALLVALVSLASGRGASGRILVAHAHHGLRPEADDDLRFVVALAADLGVEVATERLGVEVATERLGVEVATERLGLAGATGNGGEGLEARARRLRYGWLGRIAHERGARHLLVAHTADDQAETILHRALRGTGVAGLSGMKSARRFIDGVALLRPLLRVRRRELRRFLLDRGRSWREDASNADPRFARAFLRHEVLPRVEAGAWPAATEALVRLGQQAGLVSAALDSAAGYLLDRHARRLANGVSLDAAALAGLDPHLLAAVFVALWRQEGWPERGMTAAHYARLVALLTAAERRESAAICLPGGVRAATAARTLEIHRS
jgi:tRNA(Ile)-lysidine synthase